MPRVIIAKKQNTRGAYCRDNRAGGCRRQAAGRLGTSSHTTLPYHLYQRLAIRPSDWGKRDGARFRDGPRIATTTPEDESV